MDTAISSTETMDHKTAVRANRAVTGNQAARPRLLRWALLSNAVFSTLCGIGILWAGRPLAAWVGLEELNSTGISLLGFAAGVAFLALRSPVLRGWVWVVIGMDVLWVAGTFAAMEAGVFSPGGRWLAGMTASVVLLFAWLQTLGLQRLGRIRLPLSAVAVLGVIGLLVHSWSLADLRPAPLKANPLPQKVLDRGREIIERAAERHGWSAWKKLNTMDYIAVDSWISKGWWPNREQKVHLYQALGTFTSRVELLEGSESGEVWGIQSWAAYKIPRQHDTPRWVAERAIEFYLPTLHYFSELPFRIRSADLLAYGGERRHRGQTYDVVLATWDTLQPHPEHDQYEIWVSRESGLIEMVQYTVRDALEDGMPFATGTIHFDDYRQVQGVLIATKHTVTLYPPEHTLYPLDDHYFHQIEVLDAGFDRFDESLLRPNPRLKERGDWKP